MDRRSFLAGAVAAGVATKADEPVQATQADPGADRAGPTPDFDDVPNFCSHEHWGSIGSLGFDGGFRADMVAGARPVRRTTLIDILIDPYFGGNLANAGADITAHVRRAVDGPSVVRAIQAIRPALLDHALTGTYQCIRHGLICAYGTDINTEDPAAIEALDEAIARNYADLFAWYVRLMKQAHFTTLIRPVHPEYFVKKDSEVSAATEQAFTHTVMRIDPLLSMWNRSERRDALAKVAGVEPVDAETWRRFLDALFELAKSAGCLGIKQLQAYSRALLFEERTDAEVTFGGDLSREQVVLFQDWLMHECCRRADDLGWPHQVHVGTHNLPESNPLPLQSIARRYRRQKLVMLHCWPFVAESGFLAKQHPNVYIDTCWQPVLNPVFLSESLRQWLGYVPTNKITMGNDATSIEMAVGATRCSRRILWDVLGQLGPATGIDSARLRQTATDMLHDNAVRVYRIGHLQSPTRA